MHFGTKYCVKSVFAEKAGCAIIWAISATNWAEHGHCATEYIVILMIGAPTRAAEGSVIIEDSRRTVQINTELSMSVSDA